VYLELPFINLSQNPDPSHDRNVKASAERLIEIDYDGQCLSAPLF
jgi:hypothetical protein